MNKQRHKFIKFLFTAFALIFVIAMILASCENASLPSDESSFPEENVVTDGYIPDSGSISEETEHIHEPITVPEVHSTCIEEGNKEYKKCKTCGVALEMIRILRKSDHDYVYQPAIEPTCTTPGYTDGLNCSVCDWVFSRPTRISPRHTYDADIQAKCQFKDNTTPIKCTVCNETTPIYATYIQQHKLITIPGREETCTEPRVTEGKVCDLCGYVSASSYVTSIYAKHHFADGFCKVCNIPEGTSTSVLYKIVDNEYAVAYQVKHMVSGTLVIASHYQGYPVTEVESLANGSYPAYTNGITKIVLPDTLKKIGITAFYKLPNLEEVVIPEGVTEISMSAFGQCTSIKELVIPEGVVKIGNGAFSRMTSLERITLPESLLEIGGVAFENCTSLTEIVIPDGVKSIGNSAFAGCTYLEKVGLPKNLTSVSSGLFEGCKRLEEITIPESCTTIEERAFSNSGITKIHISANVENINTTAFEYCTSVKSFTVDSANRKYAAFTGCLITKTDKTLILAVGSVPDFAIPGDGSVIRIANSAFTENKTVVNLVIPSAIKEIPDGAFQNCSNLETLTVKSGITKLSPNAFLNCRKLNTVVIEEGLERIGSGCFSGCSSLTSVKLPNTLESIGESAFENCILLSEIELSNGLSDIGIFAFSGCSSLESIDIPDSTKSIGPKIFNGCTVLREVTFGANVTKIDRSDFLGCTSLTAVHVSDKNTLFKGYGGKTVISGKLLVFAVADGKTFEFPKNIEIEEIGEYCFADSVSLETLIIPDGTVNIRKYAFAECLSLKTLSIPKSTVTIEKDIIDGCSSLKEIEFRGTVAEWNRIFKSGNWHSARTVTVKCSDGEIKY